MDAFIDSLIDLQKPLIAFVDGPAVGIGCSTLGLFDVIIASDRSVFSTPFSRIALVAEGCCSYTFPRLLGTGRAAQMILFNHRLSADQAFDWGFVHAVHSTRPDSTGSSTFDTRQQTIMSDLSQGDLTELGWFSVFKRIARDADTRRTLHRVNRAEAELLRRAWLSEQHRNYLKDFYSKKSS
jgi:peroxisomal 3,2-trans-enoyl-CoA isomerase